MSEPECDAFAPYFDGPPWDLLCCLPPGHEGPHHDRWDHLMWDEGDCLTAWPEGEARP